MAGTTALLHSRRVVVPSGPVDATVEVLDGEIVSVSPGRVRSAPTCGDRWLIPGLIDTHVHGGGGAQFNTLEPDEVRAACRFHARHGTTGLLATMVSAPVGDLERAMAAVSAVRARPGEGARILGVHLEGPFLSPARPGAMDPGTFLVPCGGLVSRLLSAGGGRLAMMTIAPELPGALEAIVALTGAGVVASLGHSDGGYAVALAAWRAGARSVTHLFNAMSGFHHREPGLAGAALELDELSCELICDGLHVSAPAMRVALRARGLGGLRLVTDAMAGAGMGDGAFSLGSTAVAVARRASGAAGDGDARREHPDDGCRAGGRGALDGALRCAGGDAGLQRPGGRAGDQ